MSLEGTIWAWSVPEITPTQKLVLLRLADRANVHRLAWPSITSLENDTGLGRSTVIRALKKLIEYRLIEPTNRALLQQQERRNIRRDQVVYRLNLADMSGATVTPVRANQCHSDTSSSVRATPKPTNNLPGQSTRGTYQNLQGASPLGERGAMNDAQISQMLKDTLRSLRQ